MRYRNNPSEREVHILIPKVNSKEILQPLGCLLLAVFGSTRDVLHGQTESAQVHAAVSQERVCWKRRQVKSRQTEDELPRCFEDRSLHHVRCPSSPEALCLGQECHTSG